MLKRPSNRVSSRGIPRLQSWEDVKYFNENPEIPSTATGDFSMKPYFNVLLDDKAGHRPKDWQVVVDATKMFREKFPLAKPKVDDYLLR